MKVFATVKICRNVTSLKKIYMLQSVICLFVYLSVTLIILLGQEPSSIFACRMFLSQKCSAFSLFCITQYLYQLTHTIWKTTETKSNLVLVAALTGWFRQKVITDDGKSRPLFEYLLCGSELHLPQLEHHLPSNTILMRYL